MSFELSATSELREMYLEEGIAEHQIRSHPEPKIARWDSP